MRINLQRLISDDESSIGAMFIDCDFKCYTLEDEFRSKKVFGETRIPFGEYEIKLRTEGGFHERYLNKFGADFHKGMLWLQDVPNFEYILIHIGNDDDDTAGCILLGSTANNLLTSSGFIGESTSAYQHFYPIVRDALLSGEKVTINVRDEGQISFT